MGESHDTLASYYGDIILNRIRNSDEEFRQIFSSSIIRTGDWDWPRPDYVCYDEELNATYAIEFKPPYQSKREYLTGLGQTLAYLQKHDYSGLIVPYVADDGFQIAEFIKKTLESPEFSNVCTSLFAYYPQGEDIDILKPISIQRSDKAPFKSTDDTKTFWCWWRDISHFELYDLLNLSFRFSDEQGDIYTDFIYPTFYRKMVNRETKQWDGKPRNKGGTEASMKSEKQNYKIPLVQLELWSRSEGRLTDTGFKLLEIGKKYGPDSEVFLRCLTYLVLLKGKHLDLIHMINRFQDTTTISDTSKDYVVQLEDYLDSMGCIGKRKPSAVKTGAKNSYLRDEMKLWNKLGLLKKNKRGYFFPNQGYVFDWEHITDVLKNTKEL